MKLPKTPNPSVKNSISPDVPWKLHQIQDSGNHLQAALNLVENITQDDVFKSKEEVLSLFTRIQNSLHEGRKCILIPKKRSIEELINSRNMVRTQTIQSCLNNPHLGDPEYSESGQNSLATDFFSVKLSH